jgi:hypothetical protein
MIPAGPGPHLVTRAMGKPSATKPAHGDGGPTGGTACKFAQPWTLEHIMLQARYGGLLLITARNRLQLNADGGGGVMVGPATRQVPAHDPESSCADVLALKRSLLTGFKVSSP